MSSTVQQPSQDTVSQQLQPARATKPRKSRKAPAVKTAVIAKRSQGETITSIANDLGITRNTTRSIIEESNIDRMLEDGRLQVGKLIPESIRVVKHRLEKNSETAAFEVLKGIGVLGKDVKPGKPQDASLMVNIQQLMGNVQVNAPTTNSALPQQNEASTISNPQVIDTTPDSKS